MRPTSLVFTLFVIFITFAAAPAFAPQAQNPLTQDEILGLVKFGMDSATLAQRIQERGVDFDPTEDYIKSLKSAEAQAVRVPHAPNLSRNFHFGF